LKILQVVHDFLPNEIGGTEIYTYALSKELIKRNDVCLFFGDYKKIDGDYAKIKSYDGLPFISVNPSINNRLSVFHNLYPRRGCFTGVNRELDDGFKTAIKKFKPDIIHFQHLLHLSTNFINIAFQLKIPIIFTVHDYWFLCPRAHFMDNDQDVCAIDHSNFKCVKCLSGLLLYKCKKVKINSFRTYIELVKNLIKVGLNIWKYLFAFYYVYYFRPKVIKEIFNKVDLFIIPSRRLYDQLFKYGIPKNKMINSDLGISDIDTNTVEKIPSPSLRFGFIGSLSVHKGIEVLIAVFNKIADATLDIYGYSEEDAKKKCLELIKNKNIRIKGEFQHDNVKNIFLNIDVLIVPSLCMENSPLTVREAFATKTPVIASDIGGLSEMVEDGKTGFLFEAGNLEQLSEKIRHFIDNPAEVRRMSKEVGNVKKIEENALEIEKIYRELLFKKSKKMRNDYGN